MTDFETLLRSLSDGRVDFVIVGGLAAVAHGSARLTQDVDIVYSRTPENVRRLVAALASHSPYLRGAPRGLPFRWDEATLHRGLNFALTTTVGDIDLLGEIAGGGITRPSFRIPSSSTCSAARAGAWISLPSSLSSAPPVVRKISRSSRNCRCSSRNEARSSAAARGGKR